MRKILVFSSVGLSVPFLAWAQVAPPDALTADRAKEILAATANFLIAVGIVGAVITIVLAGIIYFFHGFSANAVTKAKGVFKNALIGTLLVLGVGVIINTIGVLITGEFFGTLGPGMTSPPGPPGLGQECTKGGQCPADLKCNYYGSVNICVREEGNQIDEPCFSSSDCSGNLKCTKKVITAEKSQQSLGVCVPP